MSFANLCWFRATSSGAGNFIPASAITGYLVPADVLDPPMVDGASYSYVAQSDDDSQKAYGSGLWNGGLSTLVRDASEKFVGAGFGGSFSAAPKVMLTALASDFEPPVLDITADAGGDFQIPDIAENTTINLTTNGLGMEHSLNIADVLVGSIVTLNVTVSGGDFFNVENIIFNNLALIIPVANSGTFVLQRIKDGWLCYESGNYFPQEGNGDILQDSYFENMRVGYAAGQIMEVTDGFETSLIAPTLSIRSDGSAAPINGTLLGYDDKGIQPGFGVVTFTNRANPGDTVVWDASKFVLLDGSTPSAVVFTSVNDSYSILPASPTTWLIVASSPGVVTP